MRRLLAAALLAALLPVPAGALLPQNDAGSGRDAPNAADPGFRVAPNRVYDGTIDQTSSDRADWYGFHADAGQPVQARIGDTVGCLSLHDPSGVELASTCTAAPFDGVLDVTAATTGTYFLQYDYIHPHTYRFSIGVGQPAAPPATAPLFGSAGLVPKPAPATQRDRHVVVAVVDTGINPYHEFFRAPALTAHPSGWLPGFPRTARPVHLSLHAADHAAANAADAATWAAVERSAYNTAGTELDEQLYTFPGTRVVAGISFGEYEDTPVPVLAAEMRAVRDDHGHGTHSAGLAAGAGLGRADGNVLVVAVEVGKGTVDDGIRWAARQPWIDAVSVSMGVVANVPVAGVSAITREAAARGKPVFIASGNGVSNTGLAPDRCTTYTSGFTGPPWITRVGAAEAHNGNPTWWHCVPVEAVARTDVASPSYDSLRGATSASGTSAATPNTAGHWAHLMLTARRVGSRATKVRVLEFLLRAAAPVPLQAGTGSPSAYPASLADQGYGLVDGRALEAATRQLVSGAGPAARPETTTWFENDRSIRVALWGPVPDGYQ